MSTWSSVVSSAALTHPRRVKKGWLNVHSTTWCPVVKRIMFSGAVLRYRRLTRRNSMPPVLSLKARTWSPTWIVSMGRPSINVPAGKHSSCTTRRTCVNQGSALGSRRTSVSTPATAQRACGSTKVRPTSERCSTEHARCNACGPITRCRTPLRANARLICDTSSDRCAIATEAPGSRERTYAKNTVLPDPVGATASTLADGSACHMASHSDTSAVW